MGEAALIGGAFGFILGLIGALLLIFLAMLNAMTAPPYEWGRFHNSSEEYAASIFTGGLCCFVPAGAVAGAMIGAVVAIVCNLCFDFGRDSTGSDT